MFPLVNECSENLLANIQKSADSDQGQFDVKSTIGRFAMDTICSAAFSRSFHTQVIHRSNNNLLAVVVNNQIVTLSLFEFLISFKALCVTKSY